MLAVIILKLFLSPVAWPTQRIVMSSWPRTHSPRKWKINSLETGTKEVKVGQFKVAVKKKTYKKKKIENQLIFRPKWTFPLGKKRRQNINLIHRTSLSDSLIPTK